MKKIYFKGFYGYKNLGDDIFTISANWICKNFWKDYIPVFIGPSLPILGDNNVIAIDASGLRKRLIELYFAFRSHKLFYFGGSLFEDGGESLKSFKYILRKLPMLSKKTNLFGVSIGPFLNKENYNSTKNLMKKVNYIGVRDYRSRNILSEMEIHKNTHFTFDLAILLDEIYPDLKKMRKHTERKKIGVSLTRNHSHKGANLLEQKKREESLKRTLDLLISRDKSIEELIFIEFNGNKNNGDELITQEFFEYFKEKIDCKIVTYSKDTKRMLEEIAECNFILGVRLHAGIISYALNIPFMLVEYHSKCTDFLDTINHNYRYETENIKKNVNSILSILNKEKVPQIVSPQHFKKIILKEIKTIRNR